MSYKYMLSYSAHFGLSFINNSCYSNGEQVIKLADNKYILYKNYLGVWTDAKVSDLLVSIVNNIPIHS